MNVTNTTTLAGASGAVTATAGAATGGESIGLGDLFSMQMVQALQSVPAEDATALAPEGLSEEDMDALEELMALLQQMLASGQTTVPQELAPQVQEKAAAIDLALQKVQIQFPQVKEDWSQLLSKLAKGESASPEMEKIAQLLTALKAQNGAQGTEKKNPVLVRTDAHMQANNLQQEANKSIQPLRFNQGLSAYKAEAGISSQTVKPVVLQDSALLNQEGSQEGGQTTGNGQLQVQGAVTGQSQASQTFQPATPVQTHHVHANQLTQQVTQIFVSQMKLTQANGVHEAKLILNPQSLGQVDVTITSHNGVITAHFSAETQAGKDLLDTQLPQLRAALTQQGLQVDRLEVNQQQETAFSFQQQREQRQQQEQNRKQEQQEEQEFSLDALLDSSESTESLLNRLRHSARGINDIV